MFFLLVDDHGLIVQAVSMLLKSHYPDCRIEAGTNTKDALELVARFGTEADLFILDLNLPGEVSGTQLLEEFTRSNPALKILVLSGMLDQQNIMKTLQLGAAGFVPKSLDPSLLTQAIDFVLKGGVFIPSKLLSDSQRKGFLTQELQPSQQEVHLSARQKDVLCALARGLPIKSICREFNLSEGTVKTHVASIYRILGARNRTEALLAARRCGFDVLV